MAQLNNDGERRPRVDDIFNVLHDEILALNLKPGDKISEADIAARFNVSRQPVRDAFSRLANLDLILIRPQRATEVRRFSMREIEKSRFVRLSVETEVLRRAAMYCDADGVARLNAALDEQQNSVANRDVEKFGQLDYDFHRTLCDIAKVDFAFDVIMAEKSKVDRLCMLGLFKEDRMPELVADHRGIADAVIAHDADRAVDIGKRHLSRLDETIQRITASNANYFEIPEA
ncbi:GntR family transcriptional regulator [Paracoccus sp. Ld10]|uniref:GntR family transcriptional regulator n=1 Tax=Paracoccus sp. Ld10 TaxID=649158 RepID=UPI0038692592